MLSFEKLVSFIKNKNRKKDFLRISLIIAILVLIGLLRLSLEVVLGIDLDGKWYSFDKDIIFVMSVFPFYLCFFLAMCAHLILKALKVKVAFDKIFIFFFAFQFINLAIPLWDYLGFELSVPWTFGPHYLNMGCYELNPFSGAQNIYQIFIVFTPLIMFFTHPVFITLGIIAAWIISGISFLLFLVKTLKVSISRAIIAELGLFHIIYWPIYKYFCISDNLFRELTGIQYHNHYGYGFYFLISGSIGLIYFLKNRTKREKLTVSK